MLSRRQQAVLPFLLRGDALPTVAQNAGVSLRTLKTYLSTPEFAEALNQLIRTRIETALHDGAGSLAELSSESIDAMAAALKNPSVPVTEKAKIAFQIWDRFANVAELLRVVGDAKN